MTGLPEDLADVVAQLEANSRDASALVDGLDERRGTAAPSPGAWGVSECLDHLAVANRVYLAALRPAAEEARRRHRMRRGAAKPGLIGRWFAKSLEPPVKMKGPAPKKIRPRPAPPLADAVAAFRESQDEVLAFVRENADLDLAGTLFPNPFVRGVRFSLATGLHVIAAHERRHLWQGWNARRAVESAPA